MEDIYGRFVVEAYQLVIQDAYQPEGSCKDQDELKQEIDALLLSHLTEDEAQTRSCEMTIHMKRTGRSWYLTLDDESLDAIYGGYLSARKAADNVLGDLSTEALENVEKAYQMKIDDANHVLRNAVHYIVEDLWNNILCNIVSCINAGTDQDGNDYTIEEGLSMLDEKMQEISEYDAYIMELDDVNYSDIKDEWQKLTESLNTLVQSIKEAEPEPLDYDYLPDTEEFEENMHQFVEMIYGSSEE
jgi:hypothetical protein